MNILGHDGNLPSTLQGRGITHCLSGDAIRSWVRETLPGFVATQGQKKCRNGRRRSGPAACSWPYSHLSSQLAVSLRHSESTRWKISTGSPSTTLCRNESASPSMRKSQSEHGCVSRFRSTPPVCRSCALPPGRPRPVRPRGTNMIPSFAVSGGTTTLTSCSSLNLSPGRSGWRTVTGLPKRTETFVVRSGRSRSGTTCSTAATMVTYSFCTPWQAQMENRQKRLSGTFSTGRSSRMPWPLDR
ncbi:hypothetical protein FBY21_2079 [Pseudomonas sp. SLBN-26]|nr:hypothetical protein FBY21_2079 [Pseudomonas sp. SLBN-26]